MREIKLVVQAVLVASVDDLMVLRDQRLRRRALWGGHIEPEQGHDVEDFTRIWKNHRRPSVPPACIINSSDQNGDQWTWSIFRAVKFSRQWSILSILRPCKWIKPWPWAHRMFDPPGKCFYQVWLIRSQPTAFTIHRTRPNLAFTDRVRRCYFSGTAGLAAADDAVGSA